MIKVTIDEALYAEISLKVFELLSQSEMSRLEGDVLAFDAEVRNIATTNSEGLNSYAVDLDATYEGATPFTSDLGGLRNVHMKGTIGTLVLENGDILVHDGAVMINHSALIRSMKAAFALYYVVK